MKKTQILVYVFLALAICGSAVIAYEAVTLPLLRGAALAQADLELFVVSLVLGVPIVVVSGWILAWVYRNRLGVKTLGRLLSDPMGMIGVLNIAIVFAGLVFSLVIRKVGFFWL